MVNFCCVPGCSCNSDRETHLSYFKLPTENKPLLKKWIHAIGRKNLPINSSTRICSLHFVKATGRLLLSDEVPSLNLPVLSTSVSKVKARKQSTTRPIVDINVPFFADNSVGQKNDVGTQTEAELVNTSAKANASVASFEEQIRMKDKHILELQFRVANVKDDDAQIQFYTGFPSYAAMKAFYNYLGPAVDNLIYSSEKADKSVSRRCRPRALPPMEELFLVLVRLRLGLMEQDLAYRFKISQSTVSRVVCTWINFLYLKLKEIPLWAPKQLIQANMPKQFKDHYLSTRVILDATEIYIEQPKLPELQQMTFSSYKNHNTFKALVGISPD